MSIILQKCNFIVSITITCRDYKNLADTNQNISKSFDDCLMIISRVGIKVAWGQG